MVAKYRLIDAMTGMPSPPRPQARKLDPNIARWFRTSREMSQGAALEEMVAAMDAGDVEFAHLTAATMGRVANPTYGVGVRLGNPRQREVIALLQKYPNFYLATSAWSPKYVPQEICDFADTSRGIDKVMWATDYPLLSVERCARGLGSAA